MWLHVQFPFVDLRSFCSKERLTAPGFPAPLPGEEFLRGAGPVRQRSAGGLSGWIAEDKYCSARAAIRIYPQDLKGDDTAGLNVDVAFRRFFFDGAAIGRFEIGLMIAGTPSADQLRALLDRVMKMRIGVRDVPVYSALGRLYRRLVPGRGKPRYEICPLARAGGALARFYARASTRHGVKLDGREVVAGAPTLFLRFGQFEMSRTALPRAAQPIALQQQDVGLYHWWENVADKQAHAWACFSPSQYEGDVRKLRLYLMRLSAESEGLSRVLKAIAEGRIAPKPREAANENLQAYINNATANVLSLSAKTRQFAMNPGTLADVAAASEIAFPPEWRQALDDKLHDLQVRKNLIFKSNRHAELTPPATALGAPPPVQTVSRKVVVINFLSNIKLDNAFNSVVKMNLSQHTSSILAFIFGVVFVSALLAVNIAIPNPTSTQHETFRIVLALAAGGIGAMIPGILKVDASAGSRFAISAGGALAVFVIVYFFAPGLPPSAQIAEPAITVAHR